MKTIGKIWTAIKLPFVIACIPLALWLGERAKEKESKYIEEMRNKEKK